MGSRRDHKANIRKYEQIGTHPQPNFNTVSTALAFSRGIGIDRKIARLRYLRDRWAIPLQAVSDRVKVLTPLRATRAARSVCSVWTESIR